MFLPLPFSHKHTHAYTNGQWKVKSASKYKRERGAAMITNIRVRVLWDMGQDWCKCSVKGTRGLKLAAQLSSCICCRCLYGPEILDQMQNGIMDIPLEQYIHKLIKESQSPKYLRTSRHDLDSD